MATYTGRHIEFHVIESVDARGISFVGSTGTAGTPDLRALLKPGMEVGLETRNFSMITGWLINGRWYFRKTDADLEAEHAALMARWEQDKRDRLERNRAKWAAREAGLPDWIRCRLEHFRDTGGDFDVEGWGYELVVAELAVLYADSAGEDTPEIETYGRREGTSGNQHDMAKALAHAHRDGIGLAGTVSALSPLTGKAGY